MKSKRYAYSRKTTGLVMLAPAALLVLVGVGQSNDNGNDGASAPRGPDYDLSWHTIAGGGEVFSRLRAICAWRQ